MATGTQLREIALALPAVAEQETWGHPTFRVRGRIFTGMSDDGTVATVKATPAEQAHLVAADPAAFAIASHVGRYGWVSVRLDRVAVDELRELVTEAWRRTAPAKLVAAHDG